MLEGQARSSQLDFLRFVAIALVFTSHFRNFAGHDWFDTISSFGWAGVDLFFVLSGFLIASQLFKCLQAQGTLSLKEFYIRRGLRIWPSYFFVLLLYLLIPAFTERGVLAPLWRFWTFTLNFGLDFHQTGAFTHAWSLCVEEHFYLVLPFLILWMHRYGSMKKTIWAFATILLGGAFYRFYAWNEFVASAYFTPEQHGLQSAYYREIYYPTYCRLDGLMVGVTIAALYRFRRQWWENLAARSNLFLAAGVAGLVVAYFVGEDKESLLASVLIYPLLALSFGAVVVAGLSPTGWFSRLRFPGAKWGATLAFSFYLTHKSIIHLTKNALVDAGVAPTSILYPSVILLACLLVSIALYLVVERPFLLLRDRLISVRNQ